MQNIQAILLEPVGCLAEFPSAPFHEIAVRWFGRKGKASKSGSRSYWHLLNLMEAGNAIEAEESSRVEALELQAVDEASLYEDVAPALAELKSIGVGLYLASSLSGAAVARFLERCPISEFLSGVSDRNRAGGIKSAPLADVFQSALLDPGSAMFLTDTAEGLNVARSAGVHPILMMNDPDEALRLVVHNPAGGIVSLHELPDFIRLLQAEGARRS